MRSLASIWTVLFVLVLSACGGDSSDTPHARPGKKPMRDAATPVGSGDVPQTPDDQDPLAPRVMIIAPEPASDPNKDEVVTTGTLEVVCRVQKSPLADARDVDQSSVRISLESLVDPGMPTRGTVKSLPDGEFSAEFSLDQLLNGPLRFTCAAEDVGESPLTGSASIDTLLDLGPKVTIIEPKEGADHQLGEITYKFEVKPAPLSDDDNEAEPTDVTLTVLGIDFDFTEDPTQPGLYSQSVDFNDRTLFPMAPTTAEAVVTAKSSRTPDAAERRAEVNINLDSDGPKIAVVSPKDLSMVRGEVVLSFTVTDPSGVDPDSVVATILLEDPHVLNDWTIRGNTYSEEFDTRSFDPSFTQLTINIVAEDMVGNLSMVELTVRIDNVAPVVSLDPPVMREWRRRNNDTVCSEPFDPVGSDALSDLDVSGATSLFRVRVQEDTNRQPDSVIEYVAGVKSSTMQLFAMGDTGTPLLIDTDGDPDNICDEVNYDDLDVADRPALLQLNEVAHKGSAYYPPTSLFDDPQTGHVPDPGLGCIAGEAAMEPAPLCSTTPMFRVITQNVIVNPPFNAIYAFAPTNNQGACEGNSWELRKIVGEGWACVAARVEDNVGNIGISPPIRICFDDGEGAPECDPVTDVPPNCTDGCAWPRDFGPNETYQAR